MWSYKVEVVNACKPVKTYSQKRCSREARKVRRLTFCLPPMLAPLFLCVLSVTSLFLLTLAVEQTTGATNNLYRDWLIEAKTDMKVEICDWYGGAAGAASISMDDSFASCRDILNKNGFKGTYYLSGTDKFSEADWDIWRSVHLEGHEIGCHTVSHQSCHILEKAILQWEFSTNRKNIITNLGLRKEDIISFAWPCGDTSPGSKVIASEYFISARGYHINKLEDKDPADFMYLKCLNTPHYHHPADDPPNYFQKADEAERLGKWVHFVFHNECLDDGAISYLARKNLWVAPVGAVTKYIKERQNSYIRDVVQTDSHIHFVLATRSHLHPKLFDQELTIKVLTGSVTATAVLVNSNPAVFMRGDDHTIMFNVRPSGTDEIKVVTTGSSRKTGNGVFSVRERTRKTTLRLHERLAERNGMVINIWISGRERLDNLRNNNIKYLFVDIGDTSTDGRIMTPREDIIQFVRLIESYEKQHGYDFMILPYSEINTYLYRLDRRFRENFIKDYRELMSLGFDGIYVDIEPVRRGREQDYLEFLREVSIVCFKGTVLGVYAGSLSDSEAGDERDNEWQWPLSFYQRVAEVADLICVPGYDFNLRSKVAYQASIRKQVESLCAINLPCQLMLTVPTHKREPETLRNALTAYNSEIKKHSKHQFIGVCVFAEWTTIPEEWNAFKSGT